MTDLEKIIDYKFKNIKLLNQAMVHGSFCSDCNESYERLEFLGDRVLGLCIAKILYDTFPDNPEGSLSQRFMGLVCKETVAGVALSLGLEKFVKIANEELRNNDSVLSDICEAVIGAVFIDGGYEKAFAFIETHWTHLVKKNQQPPKDAKTTLQEISHIKGLGVPVYQILSREGSEHEPIFSISVSLKNIEAQIGSGKSKKLAEQEAAAKMLKVLGV